MLAKSRRDWTPCWTEANSFSYWLKEAQVQACMNELALANWYNIRIKLRLTTGLWKWKIAAPDRNGWGRLVLTV